MQVKQTKLRGGKSPSRAGVGQWPSGTQTQIIPFFFFLEPKIVLNGDHVIKPLSNFSSCSRRYLRYAALGSFSVKCFSLALLMLAVLKDLFSKYLPFVHAIRLSPWSRNSAFRCFKTTWEHFWEQYSFPLKDFIYNSVFGAVNSTPQVPPTRPYLPA